MSEGETLPADTAQPESLPADTGNSLDLNELLGQMDQPLEDTSAEDMAEDPLPELTEEEMFGDTPAETDDQSAAPTDMPEDFDVQPPDVYEDNADAVQEPPASPKPKRTSRKKKEAAAPEETVTEEVPAETTESADTADSILDTEEPAVEPDVPVVEEAAAPAPTPSPPQRQPRPQRGEAPVLTIRSRDDVETAEDRDDVIWHEIHNAYRTRKIITGKLGGIEQLDNRKTVAVVDYKGFRVIIPIKEMMINLGRSPSGQEYADLMLRQNIQGKYAGRVTDVHKGVVYVRLSNGVNAVAHSCYDYRMPGKKDDVSFAVTRLDMERGVAVGIITRIIRQNL